MSAQPVCCGLAVTAMRLSRFDGYDTSRRTGVGLNKSLGVRQLLRDTTRFTSLCIVGQAGLLRRPDPVEPLPEGFYFINPRVAALFLLFLR